MTFRDRLDRMPDDLVRALTNLMHLHELAQTPQAAVHALGMNTMVYQDREFVDIRGGDSVFDDLRILHDADKAKEAVNLRTFNAALAKIGRGAAITLPFTDTGRPQVLTAENRTLGYAEGPSSGEDVLLWTFNQGVHWGPAVLGDDTPLNPDYLFGDINLVLYPFEIPFPDVPPGYLRFDDVAQLNAFCATKVLFGNVNVWFKQDIVGTLSIPNIMPPFSARLIQGNSVSFNDTLIVNNTRVRLDCGTFNAPVPFNSPKFTFNDCVFDSRSFYAVRERGTNAGNFLRLNRCRGRITVFGYPSTSSGAEDIEVNDSDIVLNFGTEHDNAARESRYRRFTALRSDILIANNVLFPGNYVDASNHVRALIKDSVLAVRTFSPQMNASYWIPEEEHNGLYNYQELPLYIEAIASRVSLSHLNASKPSWAANSDLTIVGLQSDPLLRSVSSHVHVLNVSERGYQDKPGSYTYRPPLAVGASSLVSARIGSTLGIGLDIGLFGQENVGFYIDRPAIASTSGPIGYTSLTTDTTSRAVLVDRGAATYTAAEVGVVTVSTQTLPIYLKP